jgi:DNA-binding NarL/FixJ family response regulator
MSRLRILLADDQAMVREGLRTLLELHEDFEIVGEAADGAQAVARAAELAPDIVLMDLRMPRMGGIEATRQILAGHPHCRVIVLTTFDEDEEVFEALRAGAVGYLLKASPSVRLCGESFIEPSVAAKVVAEFARLGKPAGRPPVPALRETLSARECGVLRLLAEGRSNKEIAAELGLAEGTVKNHLSNIFGKLGVLDRTQAALRARDLNLL